MKRVRLGEYDTSTNPDCLKGCMNIEMFFFTFISHILNFCGFFFTDECLYHQEYDINEIIAHPRYSRDTHQNDIALLRLNQTVRYTNYIRPICLPISEHKKKMKLDGLSVRVAGWGGTENGL